MGQRFSTRRPGRRTSSAGGRTTGGASTGSTGGTGGDLMASMQRSMSDAGDAVTEAVASASRSVVAFGLEREIAAYESKIRARKKQFGVDAYGPLRSADRQALAFAFNAARADVARLQAIVDRKRAALAALRDSATPASQPGHGGAAADAPQSNNGDAADALARALDVPHAVAAGAMHRANGDRDAAAAMILEERRQPVEAEVLSWDNPIEATLVEEPRPRQSLSKRISERMRGRL